MKTFLLHVGTHKTGTTALQVFLQDNRERFAAVGAHVVQTGRIGHACGNTNLAWELLDHRQVELIALLSELAACGMDTAIASAEDFCLLYADPAMLHILRVALRDAGWELKVIIFLRAQGPYAQSQYIERLKNDVVLSLPDYLSTILETGVYHVAGTPVRLAFCYSELLDPFEAELGRENLAIRIYNPGSNSMAIFRQLLDSLAELQPSLAGLRVGVSEPRKNDSISFRLLLCLLYSKLKPQSASTRTIDELLAEHAPELTEALASKPAHLFTFEDALAVCQRFAPDNVAVEERYGVHVPMGLPPRHDPRWDTAALHRAVFDRCFAAWS